MSLMNAAPFSALLVACAMPYDKDLHDVAQRYPHRTDGECSSWLYSHRTGYPYCASPAFVATVPAKVVAPEVVDETKIDHDSLMARGEKVYGQTCAACHQSDGKGTPGTFPPLAGAGSYYGDGANHATIVLKGLSGPITVLGASFNGIMPPQDALSDYDIAATLTYERNSWGNADGDVLPEVVKALR
jgi:mono/diheme cytochrome c family protein